MTTSASGVETLSDYVGRTEELLAEVVTDVVRANLAHVAAGSQGWVTQMRAVNRRYEAEVKVAPHRRRVARHA